MLVKHSLFISMPLSFFYTVATHENKEFMATVKFRNWPWKKVGINFLGTVAIVNMLMHTHSLLTVDY